MKTSNKKKNDRQKFFNDLKNNPDTVCPVDGRKLESVRDLLGNHRFNHCPISHTH